MAAATRGAAWGPSAIAAAAGDGGSAHFVAIMAMTGGTGIDILTGGSGLGASEVDRLRGNAGADVFVLGDADKRFYDDQSPATPGIGAYTSIEDFTPAQGDRLRDRKSVV